jgi:hypothetical protein
MKFAIDGHIAKQVGVNAALVYAHVSYWVDQNQKSKRNYREGRSWMYDTHSAISAHFGFLTKEQVRRSLGKLVAADLLQSTTVGFDRTTWYTVTGEIRTVLNGVETATPPKRQNCRIETAELPHVRRKPQLQAAKLPHGSGEIAASTLYTEHNHNITHKGAKLQRPSLEQLIEAFGAKGHPDPKSVSETFLDHYDSNGWKVGRNTMKSWRGAVGTWMKRENDKKYAKSSKGFNGSNFTAQSAVNFINNG